MSVQLLGHVKFSPFALGIDKEGVRVRRLVFGVQEMQTRFQLFDLLLLNGSLMNNVPEKLQELNFYIENSMVQ
jgi:hypothetical protein